MISFESPSAERALRVDVDDVLIIFDLFDETK
jgi:hypothetical protein